MNRRKLLQKIAGGAVRNVSFADMLDLVYGHGFRMLRISGSHHILGHPGIPEQLNLQEVAGEAKPYQIRQFLRLVKQYNLAMEQGS